jgi:hypothetical protein
MKMRVESTSNLAFEIYVYLERANSRLRDRLGSVCGRLKSGSWKRGFWNFDQSAARAEREQTQNLTCLRREALLVS